MSNMLKSRSDHYGALIVSIHWLSAMLILVLLGSGFRIANTIDAGSKAALLRIHIPVAAIVLGLTLFRIIWWWRFDIKPLAVQGTPLWQERAARAVHVAFYLVILGMLASGAGLIILSKAAPVIFQTGAVLPNFADYPPHRLHVSGALLLVVLVALHAGSALYQHFARRDGLLWRMWYAGQ
jgi:cytochrome b561